MPLSVEINAPINEVFEILDDTMKNPEWNPVINTVKRKLFGKYSVTSFMGNFTTSRTETIPNTRISSKITGSSVLKQISYDLEVGSADVTNVKGTVVLAGPEYTTMHEAAAEALLNNLKRYVEYIRSHGSATGFQKVPP